MAETLIRVQVLNAHRPNVVGNIVLVTPTKNSLFVALAMLIFLCIIGFGVFGKYTRHTTISGVIEPADGLAKIFAPQPGFVTTILVHAGQVVKKGEILIRANTEHRNFSGNDVQEEQTEHANERLQTLHEEMADASRINDKLIESDKQNLTGLDQTIRNLTSQVANEELKVKSVELTLEKFTALKKSGFISDAQWEQQDGLLLDENIRLDSIKKDILSARTEYKKTEADLASLPIKNSVSRIQLSRDVAAVRGEIAQISGERAWTIVAPSDGTVSTVTIIKGQSAAAGTPLMAITPKDSTLVVKLYAPSKSLGFIKVNSTVHMKVDAFPFQKFGFVNGHVKLIADAPTPVSEFTNGTMLAPKGIQQGMDQEPLFEVLVELDKDFLFAYGEKRRLRTGLQLDGDVELDDRRVFEWLLDPLIAATGR